MQDQENRQDPGEAQEPARKTRTATPREEREAAFWAALREAVDVAIDLTPPDEAEGGQ